MVNLLFPAITLVHYDPPLQLFPLPMTTTHVMISGNILSMWLHAYGCVEDKFKMIFAKQSTRSHIFFLVLVLFIFQIRFWFKVINCIKLASCGNSYKLLKWYFCAKIVKTLTVIAYPCLIVVKE